MIDWKEIANELAYSLYRTIEGDEVDGLELLLKYDFVDENYEWKYEDEE